MTDLKLFNSLTRELKTFTPVHDGEARVYTCGPTVYNYQHIGNMRAYVFADTLGRVLSYKGFALKHVINITDVGHLTSDADVGDDKMEKAAAAQGKTAWDIAKFYQADFEADLARLNIRKPAHPKATEYVDAMIEWGKSIADKHCYELDSGLYFDVSTVKDYWQLAGENDFLPLLLTYSKKLREGGGSYELQSIALREFLSDLRLLNQDSPQPRFGKMIALLETLEFADEKRFIDKFPSITEKFGHLLNTRRIDPVPGKRNDEDFAIWRKTPPGETRQMEWDSPWGHGAPGWHLECSVMSEELLGHPFDIHTGGIDHREVHHLNEIAQNKAHGNCDHSGARIWMHNNFLIDRRGKMSKSSGEFLRLQTLIDKGFHPLAYRLMCLQAHYRSELEFSWEGLQAAFVRLKRMLRTINKYALSGDSAFWDYNVAHLDKDWVEAARLKSVILDMLSVHARSFLERIENAIFDDLNTSAAIPIIDDFLTDVRLTTKERAALLTLVDATLGLNVKWLGFEDLRIRPKAATITEAEIETALAARKEARAAKNFTKSDAIRDDLIAKGVEVMDGDPLGWDWKLDV
jgi:cysteinyl-tRNA synthetase